MCCLDPWRYADGSYTNRSLVYTLDLHHIKEGF